MRELLEEHLGLRADQISAVPGNHDLYTQGAMRDQRFTKYFHDYVASDLPDLCADIPLGRFPFVKLRGPCAIIGLSSAIPRPPIMASGYLGKPQLEALARILVHPEVQKRTPVILLHHPIHNPTSKFETFMKGLEDADELVAKLGGLHRGLLLHGHLHIRRKCTLGTPLGELLSVGATSASLDHEHEHKMAGFNLYEFDESGNLGAIEAHVLDAKADSFHIESVPLVA